MLSAEKPDTSLKELSIKNIINQTPSIQRTELEGPYLGL